MKSKSHHQGSDDRVHVASGRKANKSSSEKPAAQRARRCTAANYGSLRKEAEDQAIEAAREIMRANVAKAREGSLAHTKWLFGLVEQAIAGRVREKKTSEDSLAERLLLALDNETRRE